MSRVELAVSPWRPLNIWRSMLSVMLFEVLEDTARAFRSCTHDRKHHEMSN